MGGAPRQQGRGTCVHGKEPTIYPSRGEARTIDFFIVATSIVHHIDKVSNRHDITASPHRAVALTFRCSAQPLLQWRLHTPKTFPKRRPIGCSRQPTAPGPDYLNIASQACDEGERREAISRTWADLAWAAEAELCGVTDHYGKQGPDMRWCGRAMGPKYAKETVLPSRGAGKYGKLDMKTYSVLWAANRLQELAALAAKAGEGIRAGRGGTGLNEGQEGQWVKLVAKFSSPSAPICGHTIEEGKWGTVAEKIQAYAAQPGEAFEFLDSTAEWAMTLLGEKVKARTAVRTKRWRAWVRKQCKAGGGGCTAS